MKSEKREHERLKACLPVDYQLDEQSVVLFSTTSDISRSGAFINSGTPLQAGTKLDIVFSLFGQHHGGPKVKVAVKGEVARLVPKAEATGDYSPGMGVKFNECTDEDWVFLEHAALLTEGNDPMKTALGFRNSPEFDKLQLDLINRYSSGLKKEAAQYIESLKR